MRLCLSPCAVACLALSAAPATVSAATEAGSFAIKGGGLQTCGAFVETFDSGGADIAAYGGWLEGFVTGHNQFNDDTFDFLPWQSTQTALGMVRFVCGNSDPDTRFSAAVVSLLRVLAPQRLTESAEPMALKRAGTTVVLYDAVLARVQARLAELDFLPRDGDDATEDDTAAALRAFQKSQNLPESGLPDQLTLTRLFVR